MCSRYSLTSPPEAVRSYFGYHNDEAFPPRYNIAPTQPVLIVRPDHAHRREIALVRWGLIPSWAKDPAKFSTLINARAETVDEKPSFRGAIRHRRCLVPADGFYEWVGPAGRKRPHLLRAANGGPIAMAGLWEDWLGADGSEISTMAIITVGANAVAAHVHDRMPAILAPDQFATWLDTRDTRVEEAMTFLQPADEDLLEIVEVSPLLNNPRNEGPEVQQPVSRSLI